MNKTFSIVALLTISAICATLSAQDKQARNPVIFADVPDMSMIRVGNTYYMSSTTMHMAPGVPIMKSEDLVNWTIVNYAYDTLANVDAMNLVNGKSTYGRGTWASCINYQKGTFYVSTFAQTTDKTYIYKTNDIEKGPWERITFSPAYHDHTIFFDDDGKIYIIWSVRKLRIAELKDDLSGVKEGTERILIEDANGRWIADPIDFDPTVVTYTFYEQTRQLSGIRIARLVPYKWAKHYVCEVELFTPPAGRLINFRDADTFGFDLYPDSKPSKEKE